jgi:Flp pilus assembly protein TadD
MSTSSTDRTTRLRGLPLLLIAAALAGCAGKQPAPGPEDAARSQPVPVRPVREQPAVPSVGASTSAHITVVPHTPADEAAAQMAIRDYFLAVQQMKAGNLDAALITFQTLSAQHPTLSGPFINQGLIYLKKKQWQDALDQLDGAIKVRPQNPYGWNLRGIALRELGRFKDARQSYEQALAIDPNYAKAHFNMGVLADIYLQDLPLALAHYERYQALQTRVDPAVNNWIADLRNRTGTATPAPAAAGSEASLDASGDTATGEGTTAADAPDESTDAPTANEAPAG